MTNSEKTINDRITTGAFWTILMRLGIRSLGLVSVIILARILVPEDFGIVAKASMLASFLELITAFGLESALIQNQKAQPRHYDTVWTLHVCRGVLIAFCLVVLATPAAMYFHEPALGHILFFYALAAFLTGLENVGVVDFRRDLNFDKDFRFNIYKKLTGFAVTVSMAIIWESYWAFVIGTLSVSIIGVIASYRMSAYRPRFNLTEWRSLFHFSKWIFLMSVTGSISDKLDTFILSRFSTTEAVGRYTVAYEVACSASSEIAMPVARATMPGLAKLSDTPQEFRSTYTLSILLVMLIAIPSALGLSALSGPITHVVLGAKWSEAARLIEILAIFGIVRAVFSISASAFLASGEVKIFSVLSVVYLILRAGILSTSYYLGGVVGLAWGVLVGAVIFNVVLLLVQQKLGFVRIIALFVGVWRVALASGLMYVVLTSGMDYFALEASAHTVALLFLEILVGVIVYIASLAGLWFIAKNETGPESVAAGFVVRTWAKRNFPGSQR